MWHRFILLSKPGLLHLLHRDDAACQLCSWSESSEVLNVGEGPEDMIVWDGDVSPYGSDKPGPRYIFVIIDEAHGERASSLTCCTRVRRTWRFATRSSIPLWASLPNGTHRESIKP